MGDARARTASAVETTTEREEQRSGDHNIGIRSAEIAVCIRRATLCAEDGVAHDVALGIRALALEPRSLKQMMAPITNKLESIRQRKQHVQWSLPYNQEKRRLVRKRYEITQHAIADAANDGIASVTVSYKKLDRYMATFETLTRLHAHYTMQLVLQYDALLNKESAWIAAWRQKETDTCQDVIRTIKRRHHITSFGVHLKSETCNQIHLWRLQDEDPQRTRCVKAATQNLKKTFFLSATSSKIQVTDVYKIDNQPLLKTFEQWVGDVTPDAKIKGLFCCVPTQSLERCVVWGMFANESELLESTGSTGNDPVFNRPSSILLRDANAQSGDVERRMVAEMRTQEASAMAFPRRFSRYSTMNEMREELTRDAVVEGDPSKHFYLALCRVAMGKIQRVSSTGTTVQTTPVSTFPETHPSVGSLFYVDEDEYVVRSPQAVVPEFLIEYRVVQSDNDGKGAVTEPSMDQVDRFLSAPTASVHSHGRSIDQQPSASLAAFSASAQRVIDCVRQGNDPQSWRSASSLWQADGGFHGGHLLGGGSSGFSESSGMAMRVLESDAVLEKYHFHRRVLMDELVEITWSLWTHTKSLWTELDDAQPQPSQNDKIRNGSIAPTTGCSTSPIQKPNKTKKQSQSLTAKKLFDEVARVRQMMVIQEKHSETKVTSGYMSMAVDAPYGQAKQKRKNGMAPRPRPFR